MFIFHHAGGNAGLYAPLARKLCQHLDVFVVQLPGRAERFREPPICSMEAVVQELKDAMWPHLVDNNFLFGHSMGAHIAYEIGKSAGAREQLRLQKLFLSSFAPPNEELPANPLYKLDSQKFRRRLADFGGTPEEILNSDGIMAAMEPTMRSDFEIVESFISDSRQPEVPLSILSGSLDSEVNTADIERWTLVSDKVSSLNFLEGGHFYLFNEPSLSAVCEILFREIE